MMDTCARPPAIQATAVREKANSRSVMPLSFIRCPASTKKGTAKKGTAKESPAKESSASEPGFGSLGLIPEVLSAIEREGYETVGLRLGSVLDMGEALSLSADYALTSQPGVETDHAVTARFNYRF